MPESVHPQAATTHNETRSTASVRNRERLRLLQPKQ